MKKYASLLLVLLAMLLSTSCVSTKKIVYFQDSDQVFRQAQQILQQYEMRLKPADQVYIKCSPSLPRMLSWVLPEAEPAPVPLPTSTHPAT